MRIRTFRGILDECLESVRRGETVESCLERYPKHAERLRPLLTLSARVKTAPAVEPRPWAKATAWDLVRQRAAELRDGKRRRGMNVNFGMWLRPVAVALAIVMAISAGGGATALASQSALPDSPLYRVKLATEDVRLWFVFDDASEADILMDQSQERMDEIMAMARRGKPVPGKVFSAMENRHSRAANVIEGMDASNEERGALLTRLLDQAETHQDSLLALWNVVSPGGREDYTEVVATLHNTRLQGSTDLVLSAEDLRDGIQHIDGEAQLEEGRWKVGGIEVVIDERTIGARELQPGATVTGIFARSGGRLQALSLISISGPPAFVEGAIEEVRDDGVVIAGQFIPFDPRTILRSDLRLGDRVEIELGRSDEGAVATAVRQADTPEDNVFRQSLTFVGTIESEVSGSAEWTVSGVTFVVPENVKINAGAGQADQGARALVEASFQDGVLTARTITVLAGQADPDEIYVAGTYEGIRDGQWIVSGVGITPLDGEPEPVAGSLLSVDAEREGTELVSRSAYVLQEPGDDPLVRVMGTVQSIEGTHWDVGIGMVRVNPSAEISGDPQEGARVLMWGNKSNVGVLQATYVRVLDSADADRNGE